MLKPGQTNGPLTVISYVDAMNVLVEFAESGNRRWTTAQYFRNLAVSDRAVKVRQAIEQLREEAAVIRRKADDAYQIAIERATLRENAASAHAEQLADKCREEFERAAAAAGAGPHIRPGAEVLVGKARTPHIVSEYTPGLLVELINPRSGVTTRAKPHIVHAKEG